MRTQDGKKPWEEEKVPLPEEQTELEMAQDQGADSE